MPESPNPGAASTANLQGSRLRTLLGAAGILLLFALLVRAFSGSPLSLRGGIRVHTEFLHIAQLEVGAPVKVGSLKAGFVESIEFRPRDGRIFVTLRIDKHLARRIPRNSRACLDALTPVGARHVTLELPDASEEPDRPLADGDRIRAEDPFPVERLAAALMRMQELMGNAMEEAAPHLGASLQHLIERHGARLQDEILPRAAVFASRLAELPPPGPWARELADLRLRIPSSLALSLQRLDALSGRLHVLLEGLERDRKAWNQANLPHRLLGLQVRVQVLSRLTDALRVELAVLIRNMEAQNGTLHAFMRDPTLYEDLRRMARRLKNAPLDLLLKRREKRDTPAPPKPAAR